ncbi:unnamed protein product [Linum tenue]|uniref:Uncharacterized protein n=1 Tax=Linum tenue TaxID=586396 RepID=A0AAV0RU86_9ROSI|nr:unnamed protein product [Linum tenue]
MNRPTKYFSKKPWQRVEPVLFHVWLDDLLGNRKGPSQPHSRCLLTASTTQVNGVCRKLEIPVFGEDYSPNRESSQFQSLSFQFSLVFFLNSFLFPFWLRS